MMYPNLENAVIYWQLAE